MKHPFLQRHISKGIVLACVIPLYLLSRPPALSQAEAELLSRQFAFTRSELPRVGSEPRQTRRPVNPSVEKISHWISGVGGAIALNDVDGDGLSNDSCYVDTETNQVLVAPTPGSVSRYAPFELVPPETQFSKQTTAPMGCLPGDVNADGRLDLLLYFWGRTPVLFLQKESSLPGLSAEHFVAQAVMPEERIYTDAASFADLDGDTYPELILGNYFQDGCELLDPQSKTAVAMNLSMSRAMNGGKNRLLRWVDASAGEQPSVQFEDASSALSDEVAHAWTLAIGTADLDGDQRPELYFGNDFGPDRLLYNHSTPGKLAFSVVEGVRGFATPTSKVVGQDSFKGMGIDFGDLNQDGHLDMYVSNIAAEWALQENHFAFIHSGNSALLRAGIAPFTDESESLGLAHSSWSWEAKLADFNNDGILETVQATGFMKGHKTRWPEMHEVAMGNDNLLQYPVFWPKLGEGDELSGDAYVNFFARSQSGRYFDISHQIGLGEQEISRAVATADVDGDGDLDFAVGNQWQLPALYLNEGQGKGHSLGLTLLLPVRGAQEPFASHAGCPSAGMRGRAALGAEARVKLPNGKELVSQVDGGNGHSGERSHELLFGLADLPADQPLPVTISWRAPSGEVQQQLLQLTAGWHTVMLGAR